MGFNSNMANREVCDLIFIDYSTKAPFLRMNYANVTTTELTGESVFAYGGKGHPKRVQFSGERAGTITIETQIQTMKLWELITGGDISQDAKLVMRKEIATDGSTIDIPSTAIVAGSVVVFKADDDCGTPLACTIANSRATLTTPVPVGTLMVVYYMEKVTQGVQRINIKSTSFPKNFSVYGDTIMKTEDDVPLAYHMIAYKVAPQSNLTLGYSNTGDPQTITITCDLMADSEDNILDLILLDE